MSSRNICLHCGACCAFFRVSFYWREADPSQGGKTPPTFVEEESEFYDNMKGTNQPHPYCVALSGKIGKRVSCAIYANRPSPCSEFGIHYLHGQAQIDPGDLDRCNKARQAWGLPPLTIDDLYPEQTSFSKPAQAPDERRKSLIRKHLIRQANQAPVAHHHRSH